MIGKGVKVIAAVAAVALVLAVGLKGGAGPVEDPLAAWVYPQAQPTGEGSDRLPLIWKVYTTRDPFEKVWEFYWQKSTQGAPVKKEWKTRTAATTVGGPETDPLALICAQFYDPDPRGKIGVMVFRRKTQTVSVTLWQRAGEKVTSILVAVDRR